MSIKPEFALKIFDGSKKYEYRRTIFRRNEVTKVVVYASDPVQKVIGEFEIGKIFHDEVQTLWTNTKTHAGISEDRFTEYFANRAMGYAIEVTAPRAYDDRLPLNSLGVASPPQSFMYLPET